jgi:hypothetical protein
MLALSRLLRQSEVAEGVTEQVTQDLAHLYAARCRPVVRELADHCGNRGRDNSGLRETEARCISEMLVAPRFDLVRLRMAGSSAPPASASADSHARA